MRLPPNTAGTVAVILAVAIGSALNVVTAALCYAAIVRLGIDVNAGLSENAVQLLTGWGSGILAVLAGYIGYVVGKNGNGKASPPEGEP